MKKSVIVPLTLTRRHESTHKTIVYKRGEKLGSGGFAAVYRITNQNGEDFALKAISKERVAKPKSLEKLKSEILIQKSLNHVNILRSYDSFEDANNYYIVLELCPGHSVKDLVKKNGHLSEKETAKILREIMAGLCYLHDNRIIHRDLKLENFLIGKDGHVKIADFGLSAKLDYDDERKYTVCGTPNYLSPELLSSHASLIGHSYEVDIWTIGVCAFAMLTGHPPFETPRTKLTYEHIKNCQYHFPSDIPLSLSAKDFIRSILQIDPERRPNALDVSMHPFLAAPVREDPVPVHHQHHNNVVEVHQYHNNVVNEVHHLHQNENVIEKPLKLNTDNIITVPSNCVARFCDHSDKYGLGYMLVDGTVGACFNDLTRMAMDPFETFVQYWESYQTTVPEVMDPNSPTQQKKLSLLRRFAVSLKKTKSMYELPKKPFDRFVPMRHVKYWMRNEEATLFRMDNRNIQVNFNDRTKLIIFWSTKKMIMVHSIKETARLKSLAEISSKPPYDEERKRFHFAKQMLTEMSER
ncbi:CAMK family protein kinase [Histomonas meleagridis]|uniref:CAMK family protein kinase n=1 Tax=Histomonas meleagridis TaxID=135588 RepID=UPI00355A7F4F|nr:CAMK family protein kinase [Histomonas meleagridis]KAH0800934.1 CAMK family protein kinase [Histomonas meleagridis]